MSSNKNKNILPELPEEIWTHIMSFLPLSDRKACAFVSKKFYRSSRHPKLRRECVINLSKKPNFNLKNSYHCEHFVNVLISDKSTMSLDDIFGLLMRSPNIKQLYLSCCNYLFQNDPAFESCSDSIEKLKKYPVETLTSLVFSSIRQLNDQQFDIFISICPNLTSLDLSGCYIHFENYYKTNCLTFSNILRFLKRQSPLLKYLCFSTTSIDSKSVESIACLESLQLHHIVLNNCRELCEKGISTLFSHQNNLKSVSFASTKYFNTNCLIKLCRSVDNLKHLNLSKCVQIGKNISGLKSLHHLCSLNLNECYNIPTDAFIDVFSHRTYPCLTKLSLKSCQITDLVIEIICYSMPNLTSLDASSCLKLTNKTFKVIADSLFLLRNLNLSHCKGLDEYSVLRVVDEALLKNTTETTIATVSSVQYFKCLEILDLSFTKGMTDSAIIRGISTFQNIRKLKLNRCSSLTDVAIKEIARSLPNIECLHVSETKVTNKGVESLLLKRSNRLEELNLSICDGISNNVLTAITKYCPNLRKLDVSYCGSITAEAIEAFDVQMNNLCTISSNIIGTELE